MLNTASLGITWQAPKAFCAGIFAGAVYVALVLLFAVKVPELPFIRDQLTARLEVNTTVPFSCAEVAEGVIVMPPLVIAATPAPVIPTVTGEPGSLPLMLTVALSAPTVFGLNDTEMVQLAPDATMLPQVFDSRKSPAFVPVTEIEERDRNAVPVFERVTTLVELELPVVKLPKFRLVGLKVMIGVFVLLLDKLVHTFGAVHPNRFAPGADELLKNNWPTRQVAGKTVPTVTGRVKGKLEKSGFLDWVARLTLVVDVWPNAELTRRATARMEETID